MAETVSCGDVFIEAPFDEGGVRVIPGSCSLNTDRIGPNDTLQMTATVENTNEVEAQATVGFYVNGVRVDAQTVTISGFGSVTVNGSFVPSQEGFSGTVSTEVGVDSAQEATVAGFRRTRSGCGSCGSKMPARVRGVPR